MLPDREWMYKKRTNSNGLFNPAFIRYVNYFLDFAYANATNIQREHREGVEVLLIRCPCSKCKNRRFKSRDEVEGDLYSKGFVDDYKVWYVHGESFRTQDVGQCSKPIQFQHGQDTEPLRAGPENASTLPAANKLLNWKSDCNVSDSTFDKLLLIVKYILPNGETLPRNLYETKKMLKPPERSWDTEKYLKRSQKETNNRVRGDRSGKSSQLTDETVGNIDD